MCSGKKSVQKTQETVLHSTGHTIREIIQFG